MTTHLIPLKSTPIPGSVSGSTPEPSLHLIPLDIIELGYTDFISSWLYTGPEGFFLTDPGPACTIPVLTAALRSRGILSTVKNSTECRGFQLDNVRGIA